MSDFFEINVKGNNLIIDVSSDVPPEVFFEDDENVVWSIEKLSESKFQLNINLLSFNFLNNELRVNNKVVEFENYRIDESKFFDDYYMTQLLVNAATRKFSSDELFFVIVNYLDRVPEHSPYLGAMITILSYRVIDNIEGRSGLFEKILYAKNVYDEKFDTSSPHAVRWFVSSSATFSMLSLLLGRVEVAANTLSKMRDKSYLVELNPLSYWNYCQAMSLLALINIHMGLKFEAGNIFLTTFIFSRNSLIDIYHPRNDWLLGQLSDCTAIMELGKFCLVCGARSYDDKIPPSSRFSAFCSKGKTINLSPLFIRYNGVNATAFPFFSKVLKKLEGM